jgi:sporulation protein YlmC with PRC-barrel domain
MEDAMLRGISTLKGLTVGAIDGEIGSVYDVYFDAKHWTVRYFVIDTGTWLSGRRVLVSPMALHRPADVIGDRLNVGLSQAQIEQAPSWDTDKPVSRQHEIAYSRYYEYPLYWAGPARWGVGWDPLTGGARVPALDPVEEEMLARERESADSYLHSARDVVGYYVQAADDDVGHVEDFLVDDETWAIRYLVVDTRNWLPGRTVVISPAWIKSVSWGDSRVYVDLSRKAVETAPGYDPNAPLERALETRLFEHYRRPKYWDEERPRR